ncbi:50S ribosomal protein L10 [Blattabacterium cuenoti]|uniref:50S ribosomal protein L10 n=1 Tax=Blattabacterium cuenoti TaxID=1653831 RepID=UPI00163CFCA7|nr:50S ribosomal protein L10 [Blattabacterium cuenoti]
MKINYKKKILIELTDILSNNDILYLIDISNLNSNQIFFLRKKFYENKIQMKVVKNSLLKKSIKKVKNKNLNDFIPCLKGNTSMIFSKNKKTGKITSKIIKNFHERKGIEIPKLKIAYVQESFYVGNNNLNILINLKTKEDLITDIIYIIRSPLENMILSLLQTVNNMYGIIKGLSK